MSRTVQAELTTMVMVRRRDTGEVLVQQRAKSWKGIAFPGGHAEPGESLLACAVREIYEETAVPFPPEIRSDTYNMEDGYMVVGNHIGYGEELDEFGARKHMNDVMFSIWTK